MAFVIGGADGIDPSLRAQADHALSFGKMVWPHMLVRVMLVEQLYRAAAILSGGPYHRVWRLRIKGRGQGSGIVTNSGDQPLTLSRA